MICLYLKRYEPEVSETAAKPQVKEWLYRKIFNDEFSFGYPRSDTCETCDLLHVAIQSASDKQQEKYQKELADHQDKASRGYSMLKADVDVTKKTAGHFKITFDLMQNYWSVEQSKLTEGKKESTAIILYQLTFEVPEWPSNQVDDLKWMIPFLPVEHRQFYMDLDSDSGDGDTTDSDKYNKKLGIFN